MYNVYVFVAGCRPQTPCQKPKNGTLVEYTSRLNEQLHL